MILSDDDMVDAIPVALLCALKIGSSMVYKGMYSKVFLYYWISLLKATARREPGGQPAVAGTYLVAGAFDISECAFFFACFFAFFSALVSLAAGAAFIESDLAGAIVGAGLVAFGAGAGAGAGACAAAIDTPNAAINAVKSLVMGVYPK